MTSRDRILDRIRQAVATVPQPDLVDRSYRDVVPPADLVDRFIARVADYRANVVRCTSAEIADRIGATVAGMRVVVPAGLPWDVPGAVTDDSFSAAALDTIDAVVTTATVAIAETGTIVLDHGEGQGRRALTLVPDTHVCVVRTDEIVAGVADAMGRLDPVRPTTWISGPSATSDIELSRVEGVHGPRNLWVVVA